MSHPTHFLFAIAISFLLAGIVEPLVSMNNKQGVELAHILILAALLYGWCKAHVKYSKITEPAGSALMCGLIGIVGVPLDFFRAFGAKQGFIKTLLSILFLIICVVIYVPLTYFLLEI